MYLYLYLYSYLCLYFYLYPQLCLYLYFMAGGWKWRDLFWNADLKSSFVVGFCIYIWYWLFIFVSVSVFVFVFTFSYWWTRCVMAGGRRWRDLFWCWDTSPIGGAPPHLSEQTNPRKFGQFLTVHLIHCCLGSFGEKLGEVEAFSKPMGFTM